MLEKVFDILKKKFSLQKNNFEHKNDFSSARSELFEKLISLIDVQSDILITVTGIKHYFGAKPFENVKKVHLVKEPGNKYDPNAIAVICDGFGKCGYVANSDYTVKQGTLSANILSGGIKDICVCKIMLIENDFIICTPEKMGIYELLLNHGRNCCLNEDFDEAMILLKSMSKKWDRAELYQLMSECCLRLSNFEDSLTYAQKALNTIDSDEKIRVLMAEMNKTKRE